MNFPSGSPTTMVSLEKLLAMLAPGGFVLVNDYGPTHTSREDEFEHQRCSLATVVGVNFAQLKAYFGDAAYGPLTPEGRGEQRGDGLLTPGLSPPEGRGEQRARC